jgi:hypothetical protein
MGSNQVQDEFGGQAVLGKMIDDQLGYFWFFFLQETKGDLC